MMKEKDQKIEDLEKDRGDMSEQLHHAHARVVELENTIKARHDLSKELKNKKKLEKSEENTRVVVEEKDRVSVEHDQLLLDRPGNSCQHNMNMTNIYNDTNMIHV